MGIFFPFCCLIEFPSRNQTYVPILKDNPVNEEWHNILTLHCHKKGSLELHTNTNNIKSNNKFWRDDKDWEKRTSMFQWFSERLLPSAFIFLLSFLFNSISSHILNYTISTLTNKIKSLYQKYTLKKLTSIKTNLKKRPQPKI